MKPTLKAPGTMHVKLKYNKLLSNFAFRFNLSHYTKLAVVEPTDKAEFNQAFDDFNAALEAGAYTRPQFSSTYAVLVTPPRVPLSDRLGGKHAPTVSHKMCLS